MSGDQHLPSGGLRRLLAILRNRKLQRAAAALTLLAIGAYAVYIASLFRQLEKAFINPGEYYPTQIFSDLTRVAAPMPRSQVLSRLENLGYARAITGVENTVKFRLHDTPYPSFLLPPDHVTLMLKGQEIELIFDGQDPDATLVSIQTSEGEVTEIFLEPELVATLSRGSSEGRHIRDLVRFEKIPLYISGAVIAIEDQHFMDHLGLDPRGLLRAIWVNLKTFSFAQGGSTLTQQLVKNLMVRRTKNIFKKFGEIFLAVLLEFRFEKEQILERYLNEVYLGQIGYLEVHGIAEGAKYFFGKRLEELNLAEAALLAGLIRGPGYYSPYRHLDRAMERQRLVLRKMVETGYIAQPEADAALKMPIRLSPPPSTRNKAPYFTDFVKAELVREMSARFSEQEIIDSGFKIYTTLDVRMNEAAQQAVATGIERLQTSSEGVAPGRLEGALAAVEHSTGYIRALVGGKSYAESTFNRILNMKRQVGSTFKPFVYLSAFEQGTDTEGVPYGPAYPIEDSPWKLIYDENRQSWKPLNYSREYRGWIPLREALSNSVNVPTAKLGVRAGLGNLADTARRLGITSHLPLVPSLTLGVAELSPIELLKAYSTLANRGVSGDLTVIRAITQPIDVNQEVQRPAMQDDLLGSRPLPQESQFMHFVSHQHQAFETGVMDLMTDLLQDVFHSGTARAASSMGFDRPAAGKTGTTSDHRDAWFAGFTPQLTAVAWVGIDRWEDSSAKPMRLTGAGSALPVWVDFMKEALDGTPPTPFPISDSLTEIRIDRRSGKLAESGCPDDQVALDRYLVNRVPEQADCQPEWPPSIHETILQ